jgi:hypothetical protein
MVAYAAAFGKEGVHYAVRNCFGVVTYEKPLCVVPSSVQNCSQASQAG